MILCLTASRYLTARILSANSQLLPTASQVRKQLDTVRQSILCKEPFVTDVLNPRRTRDPNCFPTASQLLPGSTWELLPELLPGGALVRAPLHRDADSVCASFPANCFPGLGRGHGSKEPHPRTGLRQPKADRSLSNAPAELVGFETWQQNQPPQRSTGNDSRESSSMRSTWATSSPQRMQAFACVLWSAIAARWPKTQNLRHLSLKRGNRRTLFPRKRGTKPGCGSFAARSQSSRSSSLTRSPRRSAWSQARSRSSASCTPKQSRSLQRGTA